MLHYSMLISISLVQGSDPDTTYTGQATRMIISGILPRQQKNFGKQH